MQATVFELLH